jgi:hypothetical protein
VRTYEWLPEQISTFVSTVYEIEKTMVRLGTLIKEGEEGSDELARSELALANWQTVLSNYRKATLESETTMEEGINSMLSDFKTQFEQFTADTQDGDAEFNDYLAQGLSDLSDSDHVTRFAASPGQNHISETDVRSYADSVASFLEASKANCKASVTSATRRLLYRNPERWLKSC